jgi:hypothetical protein
MHITELERPFLWASAADRCIAASLSMTVPLWKRCRFDTANALGFQRMQPIMSGIYSARNGGKPGRSWTLMDGGG